jgi:hypothetical protein
MVPDGDDDLARTASGVELIGGVLGSGPMAVLHHEQVDEDASDHTDRDHAEDQQRHPKAVYSRCFRDFTARGDARPTKPDLHALPPSEVRAGDVPEMSTSPGERAINTSTTIAQAAAIAQARAIQITDVRTRCPSRSTR